MSRLPNGTIIGAYKIISEIGDDNGGQTRGGRGQFGITYRARPTSGKGQLVAIKEFFPNTLARRGQRNTITTSDKLSQAEFEDGLAEFEREAEALDRFDHPNIVKVIDFVEKHRTAYIIMELIEGEELAKRIGSRKDEGGQRLMTVDQLRPMLLQLLDALDTLHSAHPQMLHRDIKPANIMIRARDNSPVLIDFGAARQIVAAATQKLTTILTKGYAPYEQYVLSDDEMEGEYGDMTPEQRDAMPRQGPATDLYALGAVCHFALVGETPGDALMRSIGKISYRPLETKVAGAPTGAIEKAHWQHFLRQIDRALNVEPQDRFPSAAAWAAALAKGPGGGGGGNGGGGNGSEKRQGIVSTAIISGTLLAALALGLCSRTPPEVATNVVDTNETMVDGNSLFAENAMMTADTMESMADNMAVANTMDETATNTVASEVEQPTSNSMTAAIAPEPVGHRIYVKNDYSSSISFYIRWDAGSSYSINGPWTISSGQKIPLQVNSSGIDTDIKAFSPLVQYYAISADGQCIWGGNLKYDFNDQSYSMKSRYLFIRPDGDYELSLSCT